MLDKALAVVTASRVLKTSVTLIAELAQAWNPKDGWVDEITPLAEKVLERVKNKNVDTDKVRQIVFHFSSGIGLVREVLRG